MSKIDPIHELVLLVRSGHQLLHLDAEEEDRVSTLFLHVSDGLDQPLSQFSDRLSTHSGTSFAAEFTSVDTGYASSAPS